MQLHNRKSGTKGKVFPFSITMTFGCIISSYKRGKFSVVSACYLSWRSFFLLYHESQCLTRAKWIKSKKAAWLLLSLYFPNFPFFSVVCFFFWWRGVWCWFVCICEILIGSIKSFKHNKIQIKIIQIKKSAS